MVSTGSFIQITIAVALVIILFVVGFAVHNQETIKAVQESNKQKRRVDILKGTQDLTENGGMFNTTDPDHPMYVNLYRSVNQLAGAEFTYNFWLKLDQSNLPAASSTNTKTDGGIQTDDLILILKGDNTVYNYKDVCGNKKDDVMIKSPLVKLSRGGDVLSVEFNTVDGADGTHEQSRNTCNDNANDWTYMNKHKLAITDFKAKSTNFNNKWFMVSVVIQDTYPGDPLPQRNKARCRVYINGILELDRYVEGRLANPNSRNQQVLLQNLGNLYVHPQISWTPSTPGASQQSTFKPTTAALHYMADLSYFNYALSVDEIKALFNDGVTQKMAPSVSVAAVSGSTLWSNVSLAGDKKSLTSF